MNFEFVTIVVLCVVLAVVLTAYERLVRKMGKWEREQELIEARARQKGIKIIESAKDRAMEILTESRLGARDNQGEMDKALQQVTKKQLERYKEILQNISKSIEEDTKKEVDQFKKVLEMETVGAQKVVKDRIEEEYEKVNEEVEAYKAEKMKKVESEVGEIMKEFTKIALGKLSVEQQKVVLLDALEEAKRRYGIKVV